MITQELISYIRGEVNKGKNREGIRTALLSGGGWSEADISEAFRGVMPLEAIKTVPVTAPAPAAAPVLALATTSIVSPPSTLGMYTSTSVLAAAPKPPSVFKPITISPVAKVVPARPMDTSTFRPAASNLYPQPKKAHHFKGLLIFLLIVFLVVGGGYFYRAEALDFLSSVKSSIGNLFDKNEVAPAPIVPIARVAVVPEVPVKVLPTSPINCGETSAPDPTKPSMYISDPVLDCIGASALSCQSAQATLTNSLYPSKLEIITNVGLGENNCAFRLSYPLDSTLASITNKKMAGESIACPLSIVKSFKETEKGISVFEAASLDTPSKYGAEIFFYGTAGVFIENDLDKKKIEFAGCNGGFIYLVLDSYKIMQEKQ